MTTSITSLPSRLRAYFKSHPLIAGITLILYIVILFVLLTRLDRSLIIFPLLSTLLFPPLVLSPFIAMAVPIDARLKGIIILLLIFLVMPTIGLYDSSYLEYAIQICIFSCLALGLNIVVGFAGLLDLGYVAFFAVGAYLWAMYTSPVDTYIKLAGMTVPGSSFYLFLLIGVVIAAIGGILLGLPVLRLRGDYLAIVTLGFGEMIRILAQNSDSVGNPPTNFTNGSQGLQAVGHPNVPPFMRDFTTTIGRTLNLPLTNLQPLTQQLLFYFIAIAIMAIIILIARRLEDSPIGRAWTAIREDEVAALAMGVPLVRMKLLSFAMGASFAGAMGVLYAAKQTFVSPDSFMLIQSISILAMVIVGGIGSIRGVILGAAVVELLNLQVLSNFSLQVNAWRNNDAVLPNIVMVAIAVVIGLILLRIVWVRERAALHQSEANQARYRAWAVLGITVLVVVGLVIATIQLGDFHIRNWPSQLEPAKYQRFVFGLLLIIMMIFRPAGLLPESRRRMELQEAKAADEPAPVPVAVGGRE